MASNEQSVSAAKLVDLGFMDARAKLLDIAAFLDRLDRHGGSRDFRVEALRSALKELSADQPDRARRILEQLSDPISEPAAKADTQGASGAPAPLS